MLVLFFPLILLLPLIQSSIDFDYTNGGKSHGSLIQASDGNYMV